MASACEDGHVVTQMKDLLTCPICLETLNDPRTLPCSHTFCKYCLGRFVKKQREGKSRPGDSIVDFNCPTCRKGFSLKPGEEVEDMTPNYLLCNMLEIMDATQGEMKPGSCAYCGKSSTSLCVTCKLFMCEQCSDLHNNYPGFDKHKIVPVDELSKPQNRAIRVVATRLEAIQRRTCNRHDKSMITYFCETCEEMVCKHCKAIDHVKPKHSCQKIKRLARKQKEALRSCCDMFNERLSEGEAALEEVSSGICSIQNSAEEAKCEIDRQKREILQAFTDALEEKFQILQKNIDEASNRQCNSLGKEMDQLKIYLEKVTDLVNLPRNLLNKSNEEILSSIKAIEGFSRQRIEHPAKTNPSLPRGVRWRGKPVEQFNFIDILNDLGCVEDISSQEEEGNLNRTEEPEQKHNDTLVKAVNTVVSSSCLASAVYAPEFIPRKHFIKRELTPAQRIDSIKMFVSKKIKQVQDDPGLFGEISVFMTNYLSSFIEVDDDLILLSDLLFDKCVSDLNFQYTGARLANYLDKHLKPEGILSHFRRVFFNRCQDKYNKVVNMISNNPDEVPNIAIFLGELLMNFKTSRGEPIQKFCSVVADIIEKLLSSMDRKLHICAGKLLKLTGSVLDENQEELFDMVKNMAADPKTDRTAQILFNRVCELRTTNWGKDETPTSSAQPASSGATLPGAPLYVPNISNCLEEQNDEFPVYTEEQWNVFAIDGEDVQNDSEENYEDLYKRVFLESYGCSVPYATADESDEDCDEDYESFLNSLR